jgi:hypothetical protein
METDAVQACRVDAVFSEDSLRSFFSGKISDETASRLHPTPMKIRKDVQMQNFGFQN